MADYLKVIYDTKSHPQTTYPGKLVSYLFHSFKMKKGQKFLEPGCGRGEFLSEFKKLGLDCYGIDLSEHAGTMCPEIEIKKKIDLENDKWPFPDNYFDIIYNKSLMEHLSNPDKFLIEARRVLKPGGKILCLIPDWEANYKTYFDDFTHRTPFTSISLNDIYQILIHIINIQMNHHKQILKRSVLIYIVLIVKIHPKILIRLISNI